MTPVGYRGFLDSSPNWMVYTGDYKLMLCGIVSCVVIALAILALAKYMKLF